MNMRDSGANHSKRPHVAIVSQNADLALDVRPRMQAIALASAGFDVTLVGGTTEPARVQELTPGLVGLRLFAFPRERSGAKGQVIEQMTAFLRVTRALLSLGRKHRFDALHASNPPDNLFLASVLVHLSGKRHRFVFDQHDVAPVLVIEKFGEAGLMGMVARLATWLERRSFARASLVIFANPEYERRARSAGLLHSPCQVVPNGWQLPAAEIDVKWRSGARHLVVYVGAINEQDNVEHLVEAVAHLQHRSGLRVVVAGDGAALESVRELARELGIGDCFNWLGWVRDRTVVASLVRSADVCVAPELDNPFNRLACFVKVIEYMSVGAAVVANRLHQTEEVGGDAVRYAGDMTSESFARAIESLLADREAARELGDRARTRFEETIQWERVGSPRLVEAYEALFGTPAGGRQT